MIYDLGGAIINPMRSQMRAGVFAGGCAAVVMFAAGCSSGATGVAGTTTHSGDPVPSAAAIVASTSTIATTTTVSGPVVETESDALELLATRAAFTVDQMDAIAAVLGTPTPSHAQILVAVSTRPVAPRLQLASLRDEVLTELYGDGAVLMRSLMSDWLARAHEGKDYGHDPVSFAEEVDLPDVLTGLSGELTKTTFDGSVDILSDTGEHTSLDLKAIASANSPGHWQVVDGSWLHAVDAYPLYLPYERGPELSVTGLVDMPDEGMAVVMAGDLVLVGLDGTVLGHLPFGRTAGAPTPGSVTIVDQNGAVGVLGGSLSDGLGQVVAGEVGLAGGATLIVPDGYGARSLRLADGSTRTLGVFSLDSTNRVISEDNYGVNSATDLVTGEVFDLPDRCTVMDASESDWVLGCYHAPESPPTVTRMSGVEIAGDSAWKSLYEEAGWGDPVGSIGMFTRLERRGDWWLAGFSGDCEVPDAFLVRRGEIVHVSGRPLGEAEAAIPVGWAANGRYLYATLGYNPCGEQDEITPGSSGVFASFPGGRPELLWDSGGRTVSAQLWHSRP